ncbi:hypothetical protein HPB50_007836 [Hyalomma asiaticum]|uniref:Uncharacterized protein n=1 Tax=Hyalomma asiaticum TaxID=266040 RepID=A0ACB7TGZ6_HYAAI|nr:hypothetical protein HPB50_007836 [Hyalomma asiaticum]
MTCERKLFGEPLTGLPTMPRQCAWLGAAAFYDYTRHFTIFHPSLARNVAARKSTVFAMAKRRPCAVLGCRVADWTADPTRHRHGVSPYGFVPLELYLRHGSDKSAPIASNPGSGSTRPPSSAFAVSPACLPRSACLSPKHELDLHTRPLRPATPNQHVTL